MAGGAAASLAHMRLLVVEAAPDSQPDLCLRLLGKVGFVTMSTVGSLQDAEIALFGPHIVLLELEGRAGPGSSWPPASVTCGRASG